MKILITGGAGFIGSQLAESLVRDGHEVSVLDNLSTGHIENVDSNTLKNLEFLQGDVRNFEDVVGAIKGCDSVVHLAGVSSIPRSVEDPSETQAVNVGGTVNVLWASVSNEVRRFIFASSCAVYGDSPLIPTSEEQFFNALTPYSASKASGEQFCNAFACSYDIETVSLRLFNVYGKTRRGTPNGGVVTQFLRSFQARCRPMIFGDGEQSRDFVHVQDVVRAISIVLEQPRIKSCTYNIGSGQSTTINRLLSLLSNNHGNPNARPQYMSPRAGDVRQSRADTRRSERELGFRTSTSLEEGLRELQATLPSISENVVTGSAP